MYLNKVFIIGRIATDVPLRVTSTNQPVSSFTVATNRVWTDKSGQKQESAEFHNVVVWGRQAELASQFLSKGSLVMVEGRLQTRTWQGNDGQTRRTTEVVCERIQFGPRSTSGGREAAPSKPSPAPAASEPTFSDSLEEGLGEISVDTPPSDDIKPEDLPF
jgi:single-strand DNA-binding protein